MNNKKKIIGISSVAAVAILGIGAFAYLSSSDSDYASGKVGTVDVELVEGEDGKKVQLSHSDDLDNINPGDNDPTNPEDNRPGTDHELSFEIENKGTKSVIYRSIITVSAVDAKGNPISADDLLKVLLSEKLEGTDAGVGDNDADKHDGVISVLTNNGVVDLENGQQGLVYIVGNRTEGDILDVLNGVGDNAEEEEGVEATSVKKVFDIGLAKEVTEDSPLMGATITFKVEVQAMQYRNTGDDDWDTIFVDYAELSTYTPAEPAPATEVPEE